MLQLDSLEGKYQLNRSTGKCWCLSSIKHGDCSALERPVHQVINRDVGGRPCVKKAKFPHKGVSDGGAPGRKSHKNLACAPWSSGEGGKKKAKKKQSQKESASSLLDALRKERLDPVGLQATMHQVAEQLLSEKGYLM